MSQQMSSDEEQRGYTGMRDYEAAYTPTMSEPVGNYGLHAQMPGQKMAAPYSQSEKSAPSAGQRLALGIVSMVVLFGSLFALSDGAYDVPMIAARLMGVIVVCIAAVAINFIYSFRR